MSAQDRSSREASTWLKKSPFQVACQPRPSPPSSPHLTIFHEVIGPPWRELHVRRNRPGKPRCQRLSPGSVLQGVCRPPYRVSFSTYYAQSFHSRHPHSGPRFPIPLPATPTLPAFLEPLLAPSFLHPNGSGLIVNLPPSVHRNHIADPFHARLRGFFRSLRGGLPGAHRKMNSWDHHRQKIDWLFCLRPPRSKCAGIRKRRTGFLAMDAEKEHPQA
jgi:hypothetical protein